MTFHLIVAYVLFISILFTSLLKFNTRKTLSLVCEHCLPSENVYRLISLGVGGGL